MHVFLETERLLLRRFTEIMRFINGGKPTPRDVIHNKTLPRLLHYYERFDGLGAWAVIDKSTGEFLGWLSYHPTDGGSPDNVASRRVLEKLGMTLVRTFRLTLADLAALTDDRSSADDVWDGDDVEYALSKADWEKQEASQRQNR